jgi:hypothetical protein
MCFPENCVMSTDARLGTSDVYSLGHTVLATEGRIIALPDMSIELLLSEHITTSFLRSLSALLCAMGMQRISAYARPG